MAELRAELIKRLAKMGVEHRLAPDRDDGFAGLCYGGKAFAHFHNDRELDIRLTKALIKREGLVHPKDSVVHPNRSSNSPWIEIRLETREDLDHVQRLIKLAIEQL